MVDFQIMVDFRIMVDFWIIIYFGIMVFLWIMVDFWIIGGGQTNKQTIKQTITHTDTSIPWLGLAWGPGRVKITLKLVVLSTPPPSPVLVVKTARIFDCPHPLFINVILI